MLEYKCIIQLQIIFVGNREKPIQSFGFVENNFLFIKKLHIILPQDTDEEEKVSKSLEICILSYITYVDDIIKNKMVQFEKHWSLSKPSKMNDKNDYMLYIWKLFNEKNI